MRINKEEINCIFWQSHGNLRNKNLQFNLKINDFFVFVIYLFMLHFLLFFRVCALYRYFWKTGPPQTSADLEQYMAHKPAWSNLFTKQKHITTHSFSIIITTFPPPINHLSNQRSHWNKMQIKNQINNYIQRYTIDGPTMKIQL